MAENFPVAWSSSQASGVNNIGTTASQVLGKNGQRVAVTFHNPGTQNLYVFSSSLAVAPTSSALGGAYVIFPGADITIYGGNITSITAVNGPWQAFAGGGSNNPLTMMEMCA